MSRAIDLTGGHVYVVTDLHGEREPYLRYRDHFLNLWQKGLADTLILAGDIVHGHREEEEDYSVPILLDIMHIQDQVGPGVVIMLLGNHELSHIYGVTLSKGDQVFTPRFEHALGDDRPQVITFLKSLPFLVRTPAGVMITHAGASTVTAAPEVSDWLLRLDHDDLLSVAEALLKRKDIIDLLAEYGTFGSSADYDRMARFYLAVTGPQDPRYLDLLRGYLLSHLEPEWTRLWEFFFTQCELEVGEGKYAHILERFLEVYSAPDRRQRVLVTGHKPVRGGYAIIAERQLRLASWAHARPNHAGHYLYFDASKPVTTAAELAKQAFPMP